MKIHDKGNIPTIKTDVVDDSHIKWGHIIALLVFAGIVAIRSVECQSPETVDCIISWVTNFFDNELSCWLTKQGGWVSFDLIICKPCKLCNINATFYFLLN